MLKVGDPVPAAKYPTHDCKQLSLADLRGKKVLLWFYPMADTPG
jgi:peroxiredoxin Q/BCP